MVWEHFAGADEGTEAIIEKVHRELVALGAEFSWSGVKSPGEAGGGAGLPSSPLGSYVAALRLLEVSSDLALQDEPFTELRVGKWISHLLELAGIEAEVRAISGDSMIRGCDWDCESSEQATFRIHTGEQEAVFRPRFWRGRLEVDTVVEAINLFAGTALVGCGLDGGHWVTFRSNPDVDDYLKQSRRRASERLDEISLEVLGQYRPHGFFANLSALSPAHAAAELSDQVVHRFGIGFYNVERSSSEMLELLMLLTDDQRSWLVTDAEHGALAMTAALDTLESWAASSNGMIRVDNTIVKRTVDSRRASLIASVNGLPLDLEIHVSKWVQTAAIQEAVNSLVSPDCEILAGTTGAQDVFAIVADPELKGLLHSRGLTLQPDFDWEHRIR
ncbi:MAG: hypothetical protein GY925_10190 [Actinomycetia bacterium]|nr:hypothetical protein [Actinomycetes bacterium]